MASAAAIRQDLCTFMGLYLRAFQTLSAAEAAVCFDVPLRLSTPQGHQLAADTAAVHAFLEAQFRGMKAQDYVRSEWGRLVVHVLHEGSAVVSTVLRRFAADGRVFMESGATYVVAKPSASWKITQIVLHDVGNVIG